MTIDEIKNAIFHNKLILANNAQVLENEKGFFNMYDILVAKDTNEIASKRIEELRVILDLRLKDVYLKEDIVYVDFMKKSLT